MGEDGESVVVRICLVPTGVFEVETDEDDQCVKPPNNPTPFSFRHSLSPKSRTPPLYNSLSWGSPNQSHLTLLLGPTPTILGIRH